MAAALVLARLLQFIAAGAICGAPFFYLLCPSAAEPVRPRRMLRLAAGAGAIGALTWLMAQAGLLFADPSKAFDPASVWSVVHDTGFGAAAAIRMALFVLVLIMTLVAGPAPSPRLFALIASLGALAAASFAWTGHGAAGDGPAGALQTLADVFHLLAASFWVGSLFVLAALVREGSPRARLALTAFSGIGPAIVALLVLTGLVNSWFLVGPAHLGDLIRATYGQLLLLKLALFVAMLGLAAFNRWVGEKDPRRLRLSVTVETLLGMAVLACVAWLGTLAPPALG